MEMRQVRYFLAVAETGSFTAAAKRCSIAQPSLSQQVLNLEAEVGQKLFHRLGRTVTLTEAGQALLPRARRILEEAENALEELKDATGGIVGRVSIGAIPSVAPYILPEFLNRCRTLYPELEIDTYEDFTIYLNDAVASGDLDLALVGLPVSDPRLDAVALFDDPLLLVLNLAHRLVRKTEIVPEDLAGERMILMGEKSTITLQIQRFLGGHDVRVNIVHRCAQVDTIKALVAAGEGIAILPSLVRGVQDKRRLVYRALSGVSPVRTVSLVQNRQRYLTRATRTLATMLRELTRPSTRPAD